jgi:hypothetical protein
MNYFLFVLLNAILFLRPADVVPSLSNIPIYAAVILCCVAVSLGQIMTQLSSHTLTRQPVSACVVGLLFSVLLSHVAHFNIYKAFDSFNIFYKIVLYYTLLVGALNTPRRLSRFLDGLCVLIAIVSVLGILQYHGAIDVDAFAPVKDLVTDKESGTVEVLDRLCGAGIFHNPNDISRMLILAMILCLYNFNAPRSLLLRVLWVLPFGLFYYALQLTYSRGAFIALLAGLVAGLSAKFGRRTWVPLLLVLPVVFVLFAGRATDLSTADGTGQQRIRLWSQGVLLFQGSPIFGIGVGEYAEETSGLGAHNSFIQAYTELGFVGGTLFFGSYFLALFGLVKVGGHSRSIPDPDFLRLRPYLIAMVVSYAFGMLSSSRCFDLPTYLFLGLATAYVRTAGDYLGSPVLQLDGRLALRLILASMSALIIMYLYIRISVNFK